MDAEYRNRLSRGGNKSQIFKDILFEFVGSPSAFLKTVTSAHLGYKFAIAPLANMVNNVMSTLGRMDSVLRRMAEKPFAVHGSYTYTKQNNTAGVWLSDPATYGFYQTRISVRKTTQVTWTQSAFRRLKPNMIPQLNSMKWRAIVEGLGLSPSLSAIWAVIPRSFVLDWFFPISDFLEQLDGSQPSDAWFDTLNTYSSVKTVTTGSVTEEFAPLQSAFTSVKLLSGLETNRQEFSLRDYSRSELGSSSWTPAQVFVPEPRIPTLGQWWTVAEMLFQSMYKVSRVGNPSLLGTKPM
jgi:hypothetical protein